MRYGMQLRLSTLVFLLGMVLAGLGLYYVLVVGDKRTTNMLFGFCAICMILGISGAFVENGTKMLDK